MGRGPGADGCPVGASQSVLRPQLTWLNFSIHSSINAGGAFLWATVTRPQKSTSNFLAKVSSNSEGQRSSSWRAIFPACRMELMISGTCAKEGVVRDACSSGTKYQGHNSDPQLPEQGTLADRGWAGQAHRSQQPLRLNDQPQGRLCIVPLRSSGHLYWALPLIWLPKLTGSPRRVRAVSFEKPSSVHGAMKGSKIITSCLLKL